MANMNFGVNILPKANNTYTLGNSDYKWNIFANSLNGISLTNIITDIQIGGTSIVNNNTAVIPLGGLSVLGVFSIDSTYGITANAEGRLYTVKANSTRIKEGTQQYHVIVPYNQHESTFYGLAKAAGDSTQSASSNAVGVYTENAKTKIGEMLGYDSRKWEFINEETFTNAEEADYTITTDSNDQAFELTDVLLMFETPQQETEAIKGAYGQVRFYHNSSSYFASESGQWTQAANGAAHGFMVMIEQEPVGLFICRETAQTTTSNSANWRTRYGAGFGKDSTSQGLKMLSAPRAISKIIITQVTGTGHYKLYGKRQATT